MIEHENRINQKSVKPIFDSIASTIAKFDTGDRIPGGHFDLDLVTKDWESSDDDGLFENMAACIFAGGMKVVVLQQRWLAMRSAFGGFRISYVAGLECASLLSNTKIIRNSKKIQALITNAQRLQEIQKDEGSFVEYLRKRLSRSYDYLLECVVKDFAYLGLATGADFLKDIGMGGYKPDVHFKRILQRIGLWNGNDGDLGATVKCIALATDLTASQIDRLLFRLGSGHKLQYAVCGTNPICAICLVKTCEYRQDGGK